MPDVLTQPVEPAPVSAAPSAPPETTAAPAEPTAAAPQTPAANGSPAPAAGPAAPTDKPTWDGKLESLKDLPQDPVEHAKSVRRYLTKEREKDAQRTADIRSKAEQYEKLQSDPALAQFQQWKQSQQNGSSAAAPSQAQPLWTENEWNEAQINPSKMAELVQRGIAHGVDQQIQQYAPIVQQVQQKQAFLERSQEVQEFGELHPDMWDMYEAGIMRPLVQSIVDSGKGSIADAYEQAKKIEAYYNNGAQAKAQGRILEKKNAVTAAPSSAGEPSVIWANDRAEANRLSIENAIRNPDRAIPVRIKPRS